MPHVIVKLWPGKSEQQKTRLAEEIAKDVTLPLDQVAEGYRAMDERRAIKALLQT